MDSKAAGEPRLVSLGGTSNLTSDRGRLNGAKLEAGDTEVAVSTLAPGEGARELPDLWLGGDIKLPDKLLLDRTAVLIDKGVNLGDGEAPVLILGMGKGWGEGFDPMEVVDELPWTGRRVPLLGGIGEDKTKEGVMETKDGSAMEGGRREWADASGAGK